MSDISRLNDELKTRERQQVRELRRVCHALLGTPEGAEWFKVMREHFEVDRCRFRKGEDGHDDALLRDGAAEVFYTTAIYSEQAERGKAKDL